MKPGWSKPHTHSNPTNLALFRHKITLYRFNHGGSYCCRGLKWEQGAEAPPIAPLTLTTGYRQAINRRETERICLSQYAAPINVAANAELIWNFSTS